MAEIYLAGGCFWGMEKYLAAIRGVSQTQTGYANGQTESPTYQEVCHNGTGHAETVRVAYDPQIVPLTFLLSLYLEAIDPVAVNRQGGDCGTQYRTGIYYTDEADKPVAARMLAQLAATLEKAVAIELLPLANFYPAEEYHQKYLDKNPTGYCHIGKAHFERAAKAVVNPADYAAADDDTLRRTLSAQQYAVTRQSATEAPFQNEFHNQYRAGIYVDITSGEPLFASSDKFESGCGWPSFAKPIDPAVVRERMDATLGRVRTEVRSRVGDAHLGHVFTDGPKALGGLRYCINSAALRFIPKEDMAREGYGAFLDLAQEARADKG